MRFLTAALLAGILTACNAGATTPSEQPLPTASASQMVLPSANGSSLAMACEDAFAGVDLAALATMGSLDEINVELDDTISRCPTANEWIAAAQTALPDIDTSDAQAFLAARCAENTTLASSAICTGLDS
jgi:hypothetical protein